jgi:hypothetical protein
MHLGEFLTLCFLGIIVLSVYYLYLIKDSQADYLTHPFWFDLPKEIVQMLVVFQFFAVIGFIVAIGSWILTPPQKGIMAGNMLFLTVAVFLLSAALWPIVTYHNYPVLVVISLIITAVASILLLAGSIEEENVKLFRVLGLLCLCIVTVVADAVMWNANYIIKQKQKVLG